MRNFYLYVFFLVSILGSAQKRTDTIVVVKDCVEISTYYVGNTKYTSSRVLDCFWNEGVDTTVVIEDCVKKTIYHKNGHRISYRVQLPCYWDDAIKTVDTTLVPSGNEKWKFVYKTSYTKEHDSKSNTFGYILPIQTSYRVGLDTMPRVIYYPNDNVFKRLRYSIKKRKEIISVRDTSIDKVAVLQVVNALRAEGCMCGNDDMNEVKPLVWSSKLEKVAYMHAKDMFLRSYFKHASPENMYHYNRMEAMNIFASTSGENIGTRQINGLGAIDSWRNSPGHCRNMMTAEFVFVGVARYMDKYCMVLSSAISSKEK